MTQLSSYKMQSQVFEKTILFKGMNQPHKLRHTCQKNKHGESVTVEGFNVDDIVFQIRDPFQLFQTQFSQDLSRACSVLNLLFICAFESEYNAFPHLPMLTANLCSSQNAIVFLFPVISDRNAQLSVCFNIEVQPLNFPSALLLLCALPWYIAHTNLVPHFPSRTFLHRNVYYTLSSSGYNALVFLYSFRLKFPVVSMF